MFKEYIILLLFAHILGDFYLQTDMISKHKENSIKWVLVHGISYWLVLILVSLPFVSLKILIGASVAAILHLVIDLMKFGYTNSKIKKLLYTKIAERKVFFMDQALHLFSIVLVAYWAVESNIVLNHWKIIDNFFNIIGISEMVIIKWALVILIICKPANIAIQKLIKIYKPENVDQDFSKDKNAGRMIGTIERIIMLIFIAVGQYAALGLVLTAKSIARYDKISKEKDFAEYYLLGTLLSTLIVIVISFIL